MRSLAISLQFNTTYLENNGHQFLLFRGGKVRNVDCDFDAESETMCSMTVWMTQVYTLLMLIQRPIRKNPILMSFPHFHLQRLYNTSI